MSALSIQPTFPIFTDIDGQPLEDGYIFIGVANLQPIGNPITVYWNAALTIPAAQPIRTRGGYPVNSGTPARLYVNSDYSIRVQNRNGSIVYSSPTATERYSPVVFGGNAQEVVYDPPFQNAVQTNVEAKLSEIVSVEDFGAVGDGVTDDSTAVQNAINAIGVNGGEVWFTEGKHYVINNECVITQNNIFINGRNCRLTAGIGSTDSVFKAYQATSSARWGIRVENFNISYTPGAPPKPVGARALVEYNGYSFFNCAVRNINLYADVPLMSVVYFSTLGKGGSVPDGIYVENIFALYAGQMPTVVACVKDVSVVGVAGTGALFLKNINYGAFGETINWDDPNNVSARSGFQTVLFLDGCSMGVGSKIGDWIYSTSCIIYGRNGAVVTNSQLSGNYVEWVGGDWLPTLTLPMVYQGVDFTNCDFSNCRMYFGGINNNAGVTNDGGFFNGVMINCKFDNLSADEYYAPYKEDYHLFNFKTGSYGNVINQVMIRQFNLAGNPLYTGQLTPTTFTYTQSDYAVLFNQTDSIGEIEVYSAFNTQITIDTTTTLFTLPKEVLESRDHFDVFAALYAPSAGGFVQVNFLGTRSPPIEINNTPEGRHLVVHLSVTGAGVDTKRKTAGANFRGVAWVIRSVMDTSPYNYGSSIPGWVTGPNDAGTDAGQNVQFINPVDANQALTITSTSTAGTIYVKNVRIRQVKGSFVRSF
jgi:hypothetical protein